ncbi:26693_t:CDS:1, partial [Gigaspora margarita]
LSSSSQAKKFANQFEITGFNASDSWLINFKKRNIISSYQCQGEASSVPLEDILKFCLELQDVLQNYEPKDIFNCDETALFW